MEVLYHDDGIESFNRSSADKYDGFLAVELGGVKVPVEFDNVDYISCGEVHTTPAIVNVSNKSGYTEYPNGHFVSSNILTGDDADDMAIAFHADDDQVFVESSEAQFKNFLSVTSSTGFIFLTPLFLSLTFVIIYFMRHFLIISNFCILP